jgi:D-alanyl-D-alanine carboxypeptidase
MFRKTLAGFLIFAFILAVSGVVPVFAASADAYDAATVSKIMNKTNLMSLKAKGSILIDGNSGKVLLEDKSHEKLPLASVTKVMTMLLLMEAIDSGKLSFDTKVTVSDHSYRMGGSQVWLEPGEVFTIDELLKAVAIHSANDASVALGEAIAGSEEAFVEMMNQRAKELGMNDTKFLDCSGLTDEGHYSSAFDISVMSRELLLNHPKITDYTTTWQAKFRENTPGKKPVGLDNTNKLIKFYKGATGLKTGSTSKAGFCLSASAVRDNQFLIAVVLGEPDSNTRFAEARKLLDYGFANFETTKINSKNEEVQTVEVKKGLQPSVKAIYKADVNLLLKKGDKAKIQKVVSMEKSLTAPVKKGQVIGVVTFTVDGEEVGKAELVSNADVKKASFVKLFVRMVKEWFGVGRGSK